MHQLESKLGFFFLIPTLREVRTECNNFIVLKGWNCFSLENNKYKMLLLQAEKHQVHINDIIQN